MKTYMFLENNGSLFWNRLGSILFVSRTKAVSQVKQGTLFVYGLGRRIYNCYVLITQFGWYGRGIYPVICSIETLSVVSNPQLRF